MSCNVRVPDLHYSAITVSGSPNTFGFDRVCVWRMKLLFLCSWVTPCIVYARKGEKTDFFSCQLLTAPHFDHTFALEFQMRWSTLHFVDGVFCALGDVYLLPELQIDRTNTLRIEQIDAKLFIFSVLTPARTNITSISHWWQIELPWIRLGCGGHGVGERGNPHTFYRSKEWSSKMYT